MQAVRPNVKLPTDQLVSALNEQVLAPLLDPHKHGPRQNPLE